jgi:phospholipase C
MGNSLNLIENIVVVMLENRSFDNILGSLYPNSAQFEGLKFDGSMFNSYNGTKYSVTNTSSTSPFVTPTPDPGESFPDMNLQIFNTTDPATGDVANMAGFVNDWMARVISQSEYPEIPTDKECSFVPSWPALPRTPTPSAGDIMFYFTPSHCP